MDETEWVSRTHKKKQAQETFELARELVDLSPVELASVPLSDDLREAVMVAGTLTRTAFRRQRLFVARLLRESPELAAPIRSHLERAAARQESRAVRLALDWRERLLAGGEAEIDALAASCPDVDRQQVAKLVRVARKEIALGRPPSASRRLFRNVRDALEAAER